MPAARITLWLLGGLARLRGEACSPGAGQVFGFLLVSLSRAAALRGIGIQSFDGADLARSQGPWR